MIAKINYSSPDISSVSRNPFILAPISIIIFLDLALIPYPYRNTSLAKLVKMVVFVFRVPRNVYANLISFHLAIVRIIDRHRVKEFSPQKLNYDLRIVRF